MARAWRIEYEGAAQAVPLPGTLTGCIVQFFKVFGTPNDAPLKRSLV